MKKLLFLPLLFCTIFAFGQGYNLKFNRVIDTVLTLTIPCCQDLFNNPASAEVYFNNLTKVEHITPLSWQYTTGRSNCGNASTSDFKIATMLYWVVDGEKIPLEDNLDRINTVADAIVIGNELQPISESRLGQNPIWKKAGSGFGIELRSTTNVYPYVCSTLQADVYVVRVNINALEFIAIE